jgi:hypothetical protein
MDSYIPVAILIFAFGWITFYYSLLAGKKLVTHYVALIF